MIVYQSNKSKFTEDVLTNDIDGIIHREFQKKLKRKTQQSELAAWRSSMMYMSQILMDSAIPGDSGVSIEFEIPQSNNRIDFIITGKDEQEKDNAVIIELKGWSSAQLTPKDGIVKTVLGGNLVETNHPSYQAWSYSALLNGFNQTVYDDNIGLLPCAYLHNYESDNVIDHDFYREYVTKAPLFLKSDARKLQTFIKKYIKFGDNGSIMYRIDSGKIKPSRALSDCLASMIKGNEEFIMIDDQKIVFENAMALAQQSGNKNKNVILVEGGPGTGKSVVAINLLIKLTRKGMVGHYVSKNAAPRRVYESKLTGTMRRSQITNLFKGSGSYFDTDENTFDFLVVDEAHRLNEKSGLFGNLGKNQIQEIIHSSRFSIFFLDEDQRVTLKDIGDKMEIMRLAKKMGAYIHFCELFTQFRCNGSDGYLAWLDHTLQIRETANKVLDTTDFDFRVLDSPAQLRDIILEKNKERNRARMVAGYCWDWISKKNPDQFDIRFPDFDFQAKWNLDIDGSLWMISPTSVNEIGCIHTCQGLEADYIGVILGNDLIVRDGRVITNPANRSRMDQTIKGYKKLYEKEPLTGPVVVDKIIKNTYRTLMTRGMRGCYIYSTDKETNEYIKSNLAY